MADKKTVVVATGNAHKVVEIEAILSRVMPDVRFVALGELGDFPDPVENGDTYTENAALDGAPGIFSARWAGEHGNDGANNQKLLRELADVEDADRTARFHSTVVLVRGDEVLRGDGDCPGVIGHELRGSNGFGYDPLFWPDDVPGRTMAELSLDEKNRISHRARALADLAAKVG